MPDFCNKTFKTNAFNIKEKSIETQVFGGFLIIAELYFELMSMVHSSIAPVFSFVIALYALISMYSYFGLKDHKIIALC
jgi:hypothetical protein